MLRPNDKIQECAICKVTAHKDKYLFFRETSFAPLQTDSEKADMEESLNEVFERELFN